MTDQGWGFPMHSRKAHYFVGGISLCGAWAYMGELFDTMHDHPDNCGRCMRKRTTAPDSRDQSQDNAKVK